MPNKRLTKIGAVFPHKEGIEFSFELKTFPLDGRLPATTTVDQGATLTSGAHEGPHSFEHLGNSTGGHLLELHVTPYVKGPADGVIVSTVVA